MNIPLIVRMLGNVVRIVGLSMVPSYIVAVLHNGADMLAFAVTLILMLIIGTLAATLARPKSTRMLTHEGFFIVGIAWLIVSAFGALPAYLCGAIPSYVDSFFESVSGFTTTGASILTDIEILPKGVLFWRSFTHWLGGMGVLVLVLAVIPKLDARTYYLMKAESPGPSVDKIVPRMAESARILYVIYVLLTVVMIIVLRIAGMPWFDSFIHAFGSAGTGGFSIKNLSVGAYDSAAIEMIIAVFVLIFGIKYSIFFYIFARRFREVLINEELRLYIGIVLFSVIAIAINIAPMYESFAGALRYSFFQVASIITTTGYATYNYDLWPWFSKTLIVLLMLVGACAGSTGGGLKIIRVLLIFKTIKRDMRRIVHPRMVNTVQIEGKNISDEVTSGVSVFFVIYFIIIFLSTLAISVDGFDLTTNLTAAISAIGNIGPGLSLVGPMGNFSMFSDFSKIVLSVCMLIGRLEVFPILIIVSSGFLFFKRKGARARRKVSR